MKGRWLFGDRDCLVRDLVRDYCKVCGILTDQRRRFEADGTVSFTALRSLLGEAIRKGVFWRLKDTAHHLFRGSSRAADTATNTVTDAPPHNSAEKNALGAVIDWCVGYAFHECVKLREDAFQRQHYANRLAQIGRLEQVAPDIFNPLRGLAGQTGESSSRELARISHVLGHGLRVLTLYLAGENLNRPLARWLVCEDNLARQAFGREYENLLFSLYGENREQMYVMAARDFLDAGRHEPARTMLLEAKAKGFLQAEGQGFLARLERGDEEPGMGMCSVCDRKHCLPALFRAGENRP